MGLDTANELQRNNLLRALRSEDWALVKPMLREWSAPAGTVLHQPGEPVTHAYFPRGSSLISYLVLFDDGRAIETALIGREGAIGGFVSQGQLPAFTRAEVQVGGAFYRVDLRDLEDAKNRSRSLRHLFARYADCLLAQVFQSVACNAAHSIEQRAAKWIVAAAQRSGVEEFAVTQEQLAAMLGVGRSYLSRIMSDLRDRGLVDTRRGVMRVRDMDGLRQRSCECNQSVSQHFENVLAGVYPAEYAETG